MILLDGQREEIQNSTMVMEERSKKSRAVAPRVYVFVWGFFGLQLFTYCGGKSDEEEEASKGGSSNSGAPSGGVSTGGVSTGGVSIGGVSTGGVSTGGFAGHTAHCITNPCGSGCGDPCRPECGDPCRSECAGRNPSCGGAGQGGIGGQAGGGFGGSFAGHTGQCIANPCAPGCGTNCAGAGQGGQAGISGGGIGGAGEGGGAGAGAGGAGADGAGAGGAGAGGAPQQFASDDWTPRRARSCYSLGSGEAPCLPADDGLLGWLDQKPADCEPHVTEGPFGGHDGIVRICCYTLACERRSAEPRDSNHGFR